MPAAKDPTVLMSVVAPDEPEGYRGRRRRFLFPFTRKAGGAALPALLVAASIVVVLIVVGVSQLLPKQAAGQIPIGGNNNNGQVSDDNGQQLLDPNATDGGPSHSGSPKPSKSAKPSAGASASNSASPLVSVTPTTTAPTTPPTFSPLSVEAESAMGGAAASSSCTGCSGGKKVRFVGRGTGWVSFGGINVAAAVQVNITVYYICACTPGRTLYLSVNGGSVQNAAPGTTGDWNTAKPVTFKVTLPAGTDTVKLYNPTTDAPDLDRVVIQAA